MKKSFLLCLLLVMAVLSGCSGLFVGYDDLPEDSEIKVEEVKEIIPPGAIAGNIYLNLSSITLNDPVINLHALTKEEAKAKIKEKYDFSLCVNNGNPSLQEFEGYALSDNALEGNLRSYDPDTVSEDVINDADSLVKGESFELPDIINDEVDKLLSEIYSEHMKDGADSEFSYNLEIPYKEYSEFYAKLLHDSWSFDAAVNVITGFDKDSNEFLFGGGHEGYEVDLEKLTADIEDRFDTRDFSTDIVAEGERFSVSGDELKDQYKEISSYETHTTNVAVRNKNVSLAADSINGTIVKPGEEFSYNGTVGKRTKEKGYGEAGAYLNGEVVQEIGGGVCQVSTTLYNAVFRAGLKSTERSSHTFAPSYVTPGLDATVSWGGPDYKFVNNSPYPIGIKAHYENRAVKVSIFGIPILPEGEEWDLIANKTATLGVPAPVYISSGKAENGSAGSIWEAYKVVYKNGEETERVFDHKSKYVGHTPRIYVNPAPIIPPGMTPEEYNAALAALAANPVAPQSEAAQ